MQRLSTTYYPRTTGFLNQKFVESWDMHEPWHMQFLNSCPKQMMWQCGQHQFPKHVREGSVAYLHYLFYHKRLLYDSTTSMDYICCTHVLSRTSQALCFITGVRAASFGILPNLCIRAWLVGFQYVPSQNIVNAKKTSALIWLEANFFGLQFLNKVTNFFHILTPYQLSTCALV